MLYNKNLLPIDSIVHVNGTNELGKIVAYIKSCTE